VIIPRRKIIILLGMMSKMPVAGVVWQTIHYLIGFRRLGYDVYYIEAHARTPGMFITSPTDDDGSAQAAAFIDGVMRRFGLNDKWAYQALHSDGRCYGMSDTAIARLYDEAELVINLHGGTKPRPEHYARGRLVYLETDPVALQIELHEKRQSSIDFLAPHFIFFTFGENYGRASCGLPVSDQFKFIPTRQPVIMDFWRPFRSGAAEAFTTIGNYKQQWREVTFNGETYHWSKHHEFLKILDLPRRASQTFELALGSCEPDEQKMLEAHGWRIRGADEISTDADKYRRYITNSRGEFTVAKDQNVRLKSGWFSDRSATYLASGLPVITQDTAFDAALPIGRGLFAFSNLDQAVAAVEAINSDYDGNQRAAEEIGREYFAHDKVLGPLLEACGLERLAVTRRRASISAPAPRIEAGDGLVLLASGLGDGDTGGGLYAIDPNATGDGVVERIDHISSTGLHFDGEQLYRLLWAPKEFGAVSELLVYDNDGVNRYNRLNNVADAHYVMPDEEGVAIVSTGTNSIVWFDAAGAVVRTCNDGGALTDRWHINSVLRHDGRLFACAFGRFEDNRGWKGQDDGQHGIVFDIATGQNLLSGLSCPHNPRPYEGAWLVCNSAKRQLLLIDPQKNQIKQQLQLEGWTRGIAMTEDLLFVGESANRSLSEPKRTAAIAVICRRTWRVLNRLNLRCREVYDLVLTPKSLLRGLRTGFRTNPLRVAEQGQYAMFDSIGVEPVRLWATGDPLPLDALRAHVEVQCPPIVEPGATLKLRCDVENLGSACMVSLAPNPVFVSYKWFDAKTGQRFEHEGLRTSLPGTLVPRGHAKCELMVQTPEVGGEFILRATLLQEYISWFDDLDPESACDVHVTVRSSAAKPLTLAASAS
jgi:hypothetical protein